MGANTTVAVEQWMPDERYAMANRMFLALMEAQKHICLNECSANGADHVLACLEMEEVLLEAGNMLTKWSEEQC